MVESVGKRPAPGVTTWDVRWTFWGSLALAVLGVPLAWRVLHSVAALDKLHIFFHQFVVHDLPGSLLSAGILLAAMLTFRRQLIPLHALEYLDRYRRIVAVGLVGGLAIGTLTLYHNHPLTLDEFSQLFQAKIFAEGRICADYPPQIMHRLLPVTGNFFRASKATGQVINTYWPGFAMLEAPFVLIRAPWLLNPLLTAGSLLLIRRLAERLYPDTNAPAWAMLFALASPAFIVNGISYHAMPAQLFLNLIFTLLVLEPTPRRLFAAGLVGSLALLQKVPIPHIYYALPWVVWLLRHRGRWRRLAWLAGGYAPLSLFIGLGWAALRADFPTDGAAFYEQPWRVLVFFSESDVLSIVHARTLGFLKLAAWAMPGLVVLAILGTRRGWKDARIRVVAISALVAIFGYWLWQPTQGHGWGYRYFHGAWATLPLLACGAVARRRADTRGSDTPLAALAATLAVLSLVLLNPLRLYQVDAWMKGHLAQRPRLEPGQTQVCFIRVHEGYYMVDLVQNDPFLRQQTLFVKSPDIAFERPFIERHFPQAVPRSDAPDEPVWLIEDPIPRQGCPWVDWSAEMRIDP